MQTFQHAQPVVAGSAKCLVVDDEPAVRGFLVRMLQAQGFQCYEAATGLEALRILDRIGEPPLIVSDMRMPEMTASACWRKSGPDIRTPRSSC